MSLLLQRHTVRVATIINSTGDHGNSRAPRFLAGLMVALLLLGLTHAFAGTAEAVGPPAAVQVEVPPGNPAPGDTVTAEILIDVGAVPLGSYSLTLRVGEKTTPVEWS